jgi:hypothetical protein
MQNTYSDSKILENERCQFSVFEHESCRFGSITGRGCALTCADKTLRFPADILDIDDGRRNTTCYGRSIVFDFDVSSLFSEREKLGSLTTSLFWAWFEF